MELGAPAPAQARGMAEQNVYLNVLELWKIVQQYGQEMEERIARNVDRRVMVREADSDDKLQELCYFALKVIIVMIGLGWTITHIWTTSIQPSVVDPLIDMNKQLVDNKVMMEQVFTKFGEQKCP